MNSEAFLNLIIQSKPEREIIAEIGRSPLAIDSFSSSSVANIILLIVEKNYMTLLDTLEASGISIHSTNTNNETALDLAQKSNNAACKERLSSYIIKKEIKDHELSDAEDLLFKLVIPLETEDLPLFSLAITEDPPPPFTKEADIGKNSAQNRDALNAIIMSNSIRIPEDSFEEALRLAKEHNDLETTKILSSYLNGATPSDYLNDTPSEYFSALAQSKSSGPAQRPRYSKGQ